ncbi:hypothetical protein DGMP_34450 [Desulfomarina profundi]|uniref:LapB rubredoxin metal binding domain-containing protein n=1 Tax=Desulfomarina profundi TaxID=2772557 RepID=A0A8D5JNJ8_9BACT|nr:hypothetical protein [Desulfomarina profundi]BCL62752.1 hypothetical protein DGMP_34450 [Desulfomarina profundi]
MAAMGTKKGKKEKPFFVCRECGYKTVKWLGRCPECGEWESLEEHQPVSPGKALLKGVAEPVPLHLAPDGDEERVSTGIEELDRVLGEG